MPVFADATLNVMAVNTSAPTDEEMAAGAEAFVLVTITPGLALPFADPADRGQPLTIPMVHLRFRLDGPTSLAIGQELVGHGGRLPGPSKLQIASTFVGADRAMDQMNRMRG